MFGAGARKSYGPVYSKIAGLGRKMVVVSRFQLGC
jgi:hypothetical protein